MITTEEQLVRRMYIMEDVNWNELDPLLILGFHSIGKFWKGQVIGLLCDRLWKWCGKKIEIDPISGKGEKILRKVVHQLLLEKTRIGVGPTIEINQRTIPKNI